MAQTPPQWHPEQHHDYDAILSHASSEALARLGSWGQTHRQAFMRDTRSVHRELYSGLTPAGYPEYVGTYRGAPGTSLENRRSGAECVTRPGEKFVFAEPERVASHLEHLLNPRIDELINAPATESPNQLFERAAMIFYIFGLIHPYLDGNGHVQRLLFAAAVMQRAELTLLPNWTIHPRPYDIEMAMAFEQRPNAADAVASVLSRYVRR